MIVNQKSLQNLKLIIDLFFLNISFILSAGFAQSFELLFQTGLMFALLLILNFLWIFSSNSIKFYEDNVLRLFAYQFTNILKLVVIQALTAIMFIFIVKELLFTRNFVSYYALSLIIAVTIRYFTVKKSLTVLMRKGWNVKNIIIVGAGKLGNDLAEIINSNPYFGYKVYGFVDDYKIGDNVLGKTSDLEKILEKAVSIDDVFVAINRAPHELIESVIRACNKQAAGIHIIPDYFHFVSKKFQFNMLGRIPLITVRSIPLEEVQWRILKRSFDLILSIILSVVLLWWLFPLVGILIKLNSNGPIFYKQKRIGRDQKEFICYKFRSMFVDSNDKEFIPTVQSDPRITKIGKLLRKTNIDELPQIINIFKGEMSLIGPRPHTQIYESEYSEFFEAIKLRSLVKPGITGWAQVHGFRGDDPDPEKNKILINKRIEYDIWYIENWSLTLDIQILLLTVWRMVKGEVLGR